jgi:hypothetical protein
LLDVLPDEASLAMILSHELAHVLLGHRFDTKLAFNDKLFFPDEASFQNLDVQAQRSEAEEEAADAKALEMLKNSPYKDKLGSAGLFLKGVAGKGSGASQPAASSPGKQYCRAQDHSHGEPDGLGAGAREKRTDQIAALAVGRPHSKSIPGAIRWNSPRPSRLR